MRPGMPLGRKHFRRSRDAPKPERTIGQSCCQRSFAEKSCIYLSRWQTPIKLLDDILPLGDSQGNAPARERTESCTVDPVAKHASGKKPTQCQKRHTLAN